MLRWVENAKSLKLKREKTLNVDDGTDHNNTEEIPVKQDIAINKMPSKQDVLKLHLLKERDRGLGIQISGGVDSKGAFKGIRISHLLDEGVADRDGRLRIGDEILFINGLSLISKTHKEATQLLQSSSNPVQLVISRQVLDGYSATPSRDKTNNYSPVLARNNRNDGNESTNIVVESKRVKKHTKEVILINGKDDKKLGFSIIGGADDLTHPNISIKNIMQGGIIAEDGRLKTGDIILKVNDIPLSSFKHHEAISLFKSLKKGPVKFLIQSKRRPVPASPTLGRPSSVVRDALSYPLDVVLMKEPGKGLGVGFGQSSKNGIFVKYIAKGSVVAREGKLQLKDHITSLNGINMRDTQLEHFYKIIRNLQPGRVHFTIQRNKSTTTATTDFGRSTPETSRSTPETMSTPPSSSNRTSRSSDRSDENTNDRDNNNNNSNRSNLATLMAPAIPIRERYTGGSKSLTAEAGMFDSSDDEFNTFSSSPYRTADETSPGESLNTTSRKGDGWFRRDSMKETPESQRDSTNPDDEVVDLIPRTNSKNGTSEIDDRKDADSTDRVIIERDKMGSLGLSIKMKKVGLKHKGVFAKNVAPNGSADRAYGSKHGGVKSGDEIIQVNSTKLETLSYSEVISFFKKIPKKSTFILKRVSSQDTDSSKEKQKIDTPSRSITRLDVHPDDSFSAPNAIEEVQLSANGNVIQRNSVLSSSFKIKTHSPVASSKRKQKPPAKATRTHSSSSTDSINKMSDKQLSSLVMNNSLQSPLKTTGKNQNIGVPLPEARDIPHDMNVHFVELVKKDQESMGISLVPASEECSGYFFVRRVQPGSVAEHSEQIFKGDCIHSVNGISLNGISHPQALQILKQCSTHAKIVLFRPKSKDQELLSEIHSSEESHRRQSSASSSPPSSFQQKQKQQNPLPGTTRPTLHRRTTANSSLLSIPILNPDDNEESPSSSGSRRDSSSDISKQETPTTTNRNRLSFSRHSLSIPSRSDGDESSGDSSNPATPAPLPKVHAVNKRSSVGAFVIEYEKLFKGLGVEVMMDELGVCYITDISPRGVIGNDDRIRVGDNLIAINKESVHGKPISVVRDMLRSVPRGNVQLLLKVSKEEYTNTLRRASLFHDDEGESVVSTSTYPADQHSTAGMSIFSLPLPNDVKSRVPAQRQPSFSKPRLPAPALFDKESDDVFRDDQSDVTYIPPAPPRPVLSSEFTAGRLDDDDDSDMESTFSCMPAPPPTVTNFKIQTPETKKKPPPGGVKLPFGSARHRRDSDIEKDIKGSDFDDGKSDFYIPPPPPPLRPSSGSRHSSSSSFSADSEEESEEKEREREELEGGENEEGQLDIMNQEYELQKRLSIVDFAQTAMQQNALNASESSHGNVANSEARLNDNDNNNNDISRRSSGVKKKNSRRKSSSAKSESRPDLFAAVSGQKSPVPDTGLTETYFPVNSPYHQKDKKKSLFSRLKSKLLLPSKSDIKEYESPVKSSKKPKKPKQRPLSATDFKDNVSRRRLKASISQPDLIVACHQEDKDQVDGPKKRTMKKAESLDEKSFHKELHPRSSSLNLEIKSPAATSSSSLSVKALPRILSFRKNTSDTPEKKRKRVGSQRTNVSPPHSPPPPPPSNNSINEDNQISPNNHYIENENPYESIDQYNFTGNESNRSDSSTNSGGVGSYAAEGPSIHRTDSTHDLSLENSLNTKRVLSPNVMKPPPPPKPKVLEAAVSADVANNNNNNDRSEQTMIDNNGNEIFVPTLKKRGSSLLSLNFPPPPPTDGNYNECNNNDNNNNNHSGALEPLATSSVENSFDLTDQEPESSSYGTSHGSRHGLLYSQISQQDKNDPKLKPFQLSEEFFKGLSPRDVSNDFVDGGGVGVSVGGDGCDDDDVDSDDWGSEFSASVVDVKTGGTEQNYSRYASPHRSNMFTVSTESPASVTSLDKSNHKKKDASKRKGLFKRSSSTQVEKQEHNADAVSSKKDSRKKVKSMPPLFDDDKDMFSISSPVLVKRRTTSQIFSDKEINNVIGSPTRNPSLDAIVNETINRNTKKETIETDRPSVEDQISPYASIEQYASKPADQPSTRQDPGIDSFNNTTNPVPKPPRRKSHSQMLENVEQYENLDHFHQQNNIPQNVDTWQYAQTEHHSDNIFQFPVGGDSGIVKMRPVPPIPVTEDEFAMNNSNLSQDELNELYATIDFSKKKRTKETGDHPKGKEVPVVSPRPDKVYTPEQARKSDVPTPSPRQMRPDVSPKERIGAFRTFREGSFKVKLVRQAGKSLGIVVIGGCDTAIKKVLVKEIEQHSVAAACEMAIRPGDELVEVNKNNIQGCSHTEALEALKNTPPLVLLTLRRQLHGNQGLLEKEAANESCSPGKINTEAFLASILDSSKHSKESEIVEIKDVQTTPTHNRAEPPKPNLTVSSFEAEEKINMILKTPPLFPRTPDHVQPATTSESRGRAQSVSSLNTNVSVLSPGKVNKSHPSPGKRQVSDWLEIDLYKQPGKGLGIAVTGGPSHVIDQGIRVKRLIPESIAGADGRLQSNDLICMINGRNLKGMTQGDALNFLKDIPKVINLGVLRNTTTQQQRTPANQSIDFTFQTSPVASPCREVVNVSSERKSRSKTKEAPARRSRSETREPKTSRTKEKRPSSVSRLSRFFGGSRENVNTTDKDSRAPQTPTKRSRSRSKSAQLLTIFFDKTEKDAFDFSLTGGVNTMYGDSSIVVESIRKGSEISKSLKVRDELVSIQGVDVSRLSKNDTWEYLLSLPLGRVCMVIQRR